MCRSIWFTLGAWVAVVAACGGVTSLDPSDDDFEPISGTGGRGSGGRPVAIATGGATSMGTGGIPSELEEAVRAYCDTAVNAGCGYEEPECYDDFGVLVDASITEGCPEQLELALWCGVEVGVECALGIPHPPLDRCYSSILDLSYCLGDSSAFPELCAYGTSGSPGDAVCVADCIAYGMICEGDQSGLMSCECTHGPRQGEEFSTLGFCSDPVGIATEECWLKGI